jgi:L-ascorbate metabolism protein UlaG (beta-lactamase superfamily)
MVLAAPAPAFAWRLTWIGHAGFVVESKNGTRVMIAPWLKNPRVPADYKLPDHVDAILVTHGHLDHSGSATEPRKALPKSIGSLTLKPGGTAEVEPAH